MKYLISVLVLFVSLSLADAPQGYYDSAEGLAGEALRSALHDIIDEHNSISYAEIWLAFYRTDDRPNGKVWDMYSDYEYTFGYDQGGSASGEGEGYNREHSWPTSWYGGTSPMYTDLFIIIPVDIYVNNRRSNYPYGEVSNPYWTSTNGSKLGNCLYPGYSGTVFEPVDEYKGDLARNYFYVTTRYYNEDNGWPGSPMTDGSQLLPWAENMLLEWHTADPVSTKEIDRNDEVYFYQNNRNPFIDNPDYVYWIYDPTSLEHSEHIPPALICSNAPNPFSVSTAISIELPLPDIVTLQVFDMTGRLITTLADNTTLEFGIHTFIWTVHDESGNSVSPGIYFYRLVTSETTITNRMILVR